MERIKVNKNKNKLRLAGAILAGLGSLSLAGCAGQTEQTFSFDVSCAEGKALEVEAVLQDPGQVYVSCGGEQPQSVEIISSSEGANLEVGITYDEGFLLPPSPVAEVVLSVDEAREVAMIQFSSKAQIHTADVV